MDPLSITASIIATIQLTGKVVEYLASVKHAPKDRERLTHEVSNIEKLLLSLSSHLDEGRSNEPWYNAIKSLAAQNGPLDQYKAVLEELRCKIAGKSGAAKAIHALTWKFNKAEVDGMLSRMERLKNLVQIGLKMDHFALSQAMNNDVKDIKVQVHAVRSSQDQQRHREIAGWISSTDFPSQQSDFIDRRQDGTGQWLLDSPEFATWLRGPTSTLFCPGIPGAGKTMMAAITIDHLLQTKASDDVGLAYIYCNYKAEADVNASSLLAALLKQLVQSQSAIQDSIISMYEQHTRRGTRPSFQETSAALQEVMKSFLTVYVVVDALDECSNKYGTRRQLLAKLRELQQEVDLRLMLTSRFIPEIEAELASTSTLEIRASEADVKEFVKGQIHRLPNCIQRDDQLQTMVQNKIVEAVDGMFILARLYVDSLLDKRTKAKVQATLEKLTSSSSSLKEAYDDAIVRIEAQLPDDRTLARRALSWITYAQYLLTVDEVCHALAVEPDDEELEVDNILDIEDIISICAGLVTVDKESNVVRLVHYTTQEYFEQIREGWNPIAQQDISTICLTYLSFRDFSNGNCSSLDELDRRLKKYPFMDYAARYWGHHAKDVQKQVSEVANRFLQHRGLISSAAQAMSMIYGYPPPEFSTTFVAQITGLHLLSQFGLADLLMMWLLDLEKKFVVNYDAKDSRGWTPLSRAAAEGHEAVVRLLVERDDVEADSKDNDGRTPLSRAAKGGHAGVVRLLAERDDVEADSKDNDHRTPLALAAESGHEAVVRLLVERDDVEGNSTYILSSRTPLWWAAARGHEAVVRLLLERDDIEADPKDGDGRTALSHAAWEGHEAVVRLLAQRDDVELNSRDIFGQTPLWRAASRGHEAVVRVLVEQDNIEADSKDIDGRTPLLYAAWTGHEAVVRLLLERHDINTDLKDNDGRTPLSYAAEKGHEAVVRLLVERDDIEADSRNSIGHTPLLLAAANGHEAVVRLLVERNDVEADFEDNNGWTPVSWAASGGHEAVVQLLVERDDVKSDFKDRNGHTPLSLAAQRGYEAIVRLLVERDDVSADLKDNDGRTPLSFAAWLGHEAIVRLLVERDDVSADSKDSNGRTPLLWAAWGGQEAVVRLLAERDDVEADFEDNNGWTPVSWAASGGHEAVVRLLVQRDDVAADLKDGKDLKDCDSRTPLSRAASRGHEAVVRLLVERDDVSADRRNSDGLTPLSWAAWQGHEAVTRLLVERDDVNADSKDICCRTPLSWAAGEGHEAIVRLLLEQDDVDADSKDSYCRTPLSWAVCGGHEAVVRLLVERDDVDADSMDSYDRTPLSWAVWGGHEAVARLLVERDDVNADSKDSYGRTPLSWAAGEGHEAIVRLLLERDDVDADLKDCSLLTPLSWASKKGHEAAVRLLVERNDVEADSKDRAGRTPLSWAAQGGLEAVVRLLVERNDVEADLKDCYGITPLSWAAAGGHEAVVRLLAERDDVEDSKDGELIEATAKGQEAVFKLLHLKLSYTDTATISTSSS